MHYVLPIANLQDPLSPTEIDDSPNADRIWASLAAARGDLSYTEEDMEQVTEEAEQKTRDAAYADAQDSARSVVKSLELRLEQDEEGEIHVVSNGIPADDFESDLQELIMNEAQRLIDSIDWEDPE